MKETGAIKFHYESSGTELALFPGFEELNSGTEKGEVRLYHHSQS